jgi:RNA polymerase sigma factor (sigma-70 family)
MASPSDQIPSRLPDTALIALSQTQDRRAYGELVRRHAGKVYAFVRRLGAAPELAEDVTQETFLVAMSDIRGYRGEASFANWLRKVAARTLFRKRRKDKGLVFLAEPVDADAADQASDADPSMPLDLDAALDKLSGAERTCVMLSHGASLSHAEIAEVLRMPLGTVKSHIARGLSRLRTYLSAYGPEGDHR